jgi:hypothetical protein
MVRTGGPIVYRLGRYPFKVERRVRFPLGLSQQSQVLVQVQVESQV